MINWNESTNEERISLYQCFKIAADYKGVSIPEMYSIILDNPMPQGYGSSFTTGLYSRKKAQKIFDWLSNNYPKILINEFGENVVPTIATEIKTPQPVLERLTVDAHSETRFFFRSRAIPYIIPEDAIRMLEQFRNAQEVFSWHVLTGSGGTGKSRLALEYAIEVESIKEWNIGFLSLNSARTFNWENWQPIKPCFLIVDYAARETELISTILSVLSQRNDLKAPVRLLLLERELGGIWFKKVTQQGSLAWHYIDQCWFDEDGELEAPEDVWPIIKHMCNNNVANLPGQKEAINELKRIDHLSRPLFAAFLGDAYARGINPRNWDAYALVNNVLSHEKRYWENGDIEQTHINMCACATSTSGIPAQWLEDFTLSEMKGFWPEWTGINTLDKLSFIYGHTVVDDIPPLEPDILGRVVN